MKKLRFLFFTAAIVALVGFVGCSKDNTGDNTGVDGEKAYARITLTQSASGLTKAPTDSEKPTADEKKVKTATIYVFKQPTRVLEKIVPMAIVGDAAESKVVEITTGPHSFYVVINAPSGKITGVTEGMTMTAFEQKVLDITSISEITGATDGFFITSTEAADVKTIVEATEAEATGGSKNNFTFQVGRAMAKANVDFKPTIQSGGELTNVQYLVRAQPNKMYLMPNYDNGVFVTPYHKITPADATEIAQNYFPNSPHADADFLVADGTKASYMMENSNDKPLQGTATYLLIKGQFIPETTYDTEGLFPQTPTAAADFWRIRKTDGSYTDKVYRQLPIQQEIDTEGGAGANAEKYTDGVCYYSYWISNQALGTVNKAYDIKRNTYYFTTITSVSGPGASDPDDPDIVDPEKPVTTNAWIKATIEHLDWVLIDQSGGI